MQIRFSTVPVVGALLTVLAVLALSVAPAFGQAVAIDEGDDVQYNGVCQNIIGSIDDITAGNSAGATSGANANATADDESEAAAQADSVAEIAQEAGVTIEQVNECLNGTDADTTDDDTDTTDTDTTDTTDDDDTRLAAVDDPDAVKSASIPEVKALVNTGGFPILTGAGLMLVAAIAVGTRVIGRR